MFGKRFDKMRLIKKIVCKNYMKYNFIIIEMSFILFPY